MDDNDLDTVIENVHGMRDETINISDVIEVIETDPDFKESTNMFNGGSEISVQSTKSTVSARRHNAYVKIIEQPASKALRFRYECEGRSAGSIPGASSTPENKTYPAIQIVGYKGRAVVVVSCVTKDSPYRPHPHNLVGREGCKRGVCTLEISPDTMTATFSNLGIQCVKKKDIENALRVREEIRVDPFRTGFGHRNQPTSIDLNTVRLCFQVFLENDVPGKFSLPLTPVVSEPIYDKKAMSDLNIIKLSDCVSYVDGGRKDIILLCEKVAKEDIQVRFYEEKDGMVVWEGLADFQPSQVHKQHAIWFKTPRYRTFDITEPVKVFIQLRRPSDGAASEPLPFEFLPLDSEPGMLKRKRPKIDDPNHVLRHLKEHDKHNNFYTLNIPMEPVKTEPRDTTPSPYGGNMYGGGISPCYTSNSGLSPHHMQQPTSPPDVYNIQYNLPSIGGAASTNLLTTNWNIPTSTTITTNDFTGGATISMDNPTSSSLLNLDSQVINELATSIMGAEPLPEINSLSLSDMGLQGHDQNMTDSLTRLANNTIDNMCQMNNL